MKDIKHLKEKIKDEFNLACYKSFNFKPSSSISLEFPPDINLGDFTISCFFLEEKLKKDPSIIASEITSNFKKDSIIKKVSSIGPYVNIKIRERVLFEFLCSGIINKNFLNSFKEEGGEKIMIEYLSPNTNKPLHLGHIRNGVIGMSIANLLEITGNKTIKTNLTNDRGASICKSMIAYQKWGGNKTPQSEKIKGDHFVGKMYALYSQKEKVNPTIKKDVNDCLIKWENNDAEIISLWKKMNKWVYSGFKKTYKKFGFLFDEIFFESNTYKLGKKIIKKGLEKKLFKKIHKEAIIFELPVDVFGEDKNGNPRIITLIRADGTSLYITQDIGSAIKKFENFNLNRSIHVVGNEQKNHFKVLFYILKKLGYSWAEKCEHLSYGMVYLPHGKMKSREGNVVDGDNLIEEIESLVKDKYNTGKEKTEKIALAAIKFFLLKPNIQKDIYFDPQKSISLEGATGPYCQYAYARGHALLEKSKNKKLDKIKPDFSLLGNEEELLIVKNIIELHETIKQSAELLKPSLLCTKIHETAQVFNKFYQNHKIINSGDNPGLISARLKLVEATIKSLKVALNLLGIEVIKKM